MPDAAQAPAAPAAVKSGFVSSEFVFHAAAAVAIALLQFFLNHASELGLPPVALGIVNAVCPLAIAWLAKSYGDQRSELKQAALAAQAAQASPSAAAKALNQ